MSSLWYSQWLLFLLLFQELQNSQKSSIRDKTKQMHEKTVIMTSDTYQLRSLWWATRCKSIHLCKYQSGQISGRQSEAPDPLRVHPQWCHSTGENITSQVNGWRIKKGLQKKCWKQLTYKHVISPFVSGRITVEVFCKAWLHMCAFIL